MHDRTRFLTFVDSPTCERLLAEARAASFRPHAIGRRGAMGPLRHGETAHIRDVVPKENAVQEDNLHRFPLFRAFVKALFGTERIGKSYWHRMKAGRGIYRHIDCGDYYESTHRFQLFPDTERGQVALIDGAEQHYESGTLLAFNPAVPHAYENRSAKDCLFLVFDLYPGEYRLP